MLRVVMNPDLLENYGFMHTRRIRVNDGKLLEEKYQYMLSYESNIELAYVDYNRELHIKNYAYNQVFVENVLPQLIQDGLVVWEYNEEVKK